MIIEALIALWAIVFVRKVVSYANAPARKRRQWECPNGLTFKRCRCGHKPR